jgi:2-dehydropantoate 2-reductase
VTGRIAVLGAGAIGCYVGGMLAVAGRDVRFLARAVGLGAFHAGRLQLSDLEGGAAELALGALGMTADPVTALDRAGIVLVCVKARDTGAAAEILARHAPEDAIVVSLQNGLSPARALKAALPGRDVRAGMVAFNVVRRVGTGFHRATSGEIAIVRGAVPLELSVPGLRVAETRDIEAVQWGKLLINLANGPNALSGLPIRAMLMDRGWRRASSRARRRPCLHGSCPPCCDCRRPCSGASPRG